MDDLKISALELQALAAQDRLRLAIARNVTINGRWFCALLVIANVAAGSYALAVAAAAPVGLSCLVDMMAGGRRRTAASIAVYALAVAIALASFINAR